MIERRKSRVVTAGNVKFGGDNPISVQSMLNAPAEDVDANVRQAVALENAGCQIVRLTVPNKEAIKTLYAVKDAVKIGTNVIIASAKCSIKDILSGKAKATRIGVR